MRLRAESLDEFDRIIHDMASAYQASPLSTHPDTPGRILHFSDIDLGCVVQLFSRRTALASGTLYIERHGAGER